jgi:hypothetical protein
VKPVLWKIWKIFVNKQDEKTKEFFKAHKYWCGAENEWSQKKLSSAICDLTLLSRLRLSEFCFLYKFLSVFFFRFFSWLTW